MPVPYAMQSYLHHKLYHDTDNTPLLIQNRRQQWPSTPAVLNQSNSSDSLAHPTYNHRPSPSVQNAKYSPFPSPNKLSPLSKPTAALLPLIAKFESLDAESFGVEHHKELTPKPLKFRRRSSRVSELRPTLKTRATGLREKVVALMDKSHNWTEEKLDVKEEHAAVTSRSSLDIAPGKQLPKRIPETQSRNSIPAAPKGTKQSWARQCGPPFEPPEPVTQVSLATARTWRPHSKRRKQSALGSRRESKIKDRIRFFDGSMDFQLQKIHISEVRGEADFEHESADGSQQPINHTGTVLVKTAFVDQKRGQEHTFKPRPRAKTTPSLSIDRRDKSVASVGSSDRSPVQSLPPGYDFSPVRQPKRGRTRERTLHNADPHTALRGSTRPMFLEHEMAENDNGQLPTAKDNSDDHTVFLKLLNDDKTGSSRSRSMVQERIRQFSFGNSVQRRNTSPAKDGILKVEPPVEEVLSDAEVELDEDSKENIQADPFSSSGSRKEAKQKDRSLPIRKHLSAIESRIKFFEQYEGDCLYDTKSGKRFHSVSHRNTEIKFDSHSAETKTWNVPSDFGSPLKRTRRAPTPAPAFYTKHGLPTENKTSKGKERLKHWWNEGREYLPTQPKKELPQSNHKTRAREERINRRAARGSPEKTKSPQRDDDIGIAVRARETSVHCSSTQESDVAHIEVVIDDTESTVSPSIVKEIWVHSRSQTPSFSTVAVETSHDDETPTSTLKLVLEKFTPSKMKSKDLNVGEPDIHTVDTIIAQCTLSQPKPKRLLEIQRMMRLCKRFAEKDGSWSRETATH